MAGLARPGASRDDALFWLALPGMALVGAPAVVAGALAGGALLLQWRLSAGVRCLRR